MKVIKQGKILWTHILQPTQKDFEFLSKNYQFSEQDLDSCRLKNKRSQIKMKDDQALIIFKYPLLGIQEFNLSFEEINIFWHKEQVLTICHGTKCKVNEMFEQYQQLANPPPIISNPECLRPDSIKTESNRLLSDQIEERRSATPSALLEKKQPKQQLSDLEKGTDFIMQKILQELIMNIFPIMETFSKEIEQVDECVKKFIPPSIIERVQIIRRNMIFLDTFLKNQKKIVSTVVSNYDLTSRKGSSDIAPDFFFKKGEIQMKKIQPVKPVNWVHLKMQASQLLDMAEDQRELIDGLASSIDSELNFRTNDIMKALTIFSMVMLPLGIITGQFGMNTKLPFVNFESYDGAIGIVVSLVVVSIVLTLFFKFYIAK